MWEFRDVMHERADYMSLTIKPNERVYPISEGLDALGYVLTYDKDSNTVIIKLRKRNKQRFARKIKRMKSQRRRNELTASFYSLCKHGNCNNLFYQLTGITMKDFKDLKIKPKYQDGKERFNVPRVSIKDLCNQTVTILKFEKGIIPTWQTEEYKKDVDKAKSRLQNLLDEYGTIDKIPEDEPWTNPDLIPKPEGRYVIFIETEEGKRKFFTGDHDIWSILDQAKEQGELPFRTTIKKVPNVTNKYEFT